MLANVFTKENIKKFILDAVFILIGCAAGAFSIIGILIPNGLSIGGIAGICRLLQELTGINYSILYYTFSFLILIACALLLGLREARKLVMMTVLFPAILMLFERLNITLLQEKDIILAAIYCGIFSGACSGLVFSRGYSIGGTDTVAKIIKVRWLPQVGISKIILVIDGLIIVVSGLYFGRNIALYALITQIILSKTIDYVMYGFDAKIVQVEIITNQHDEVVEYILNEIRRGVTNVEVVGAYTKYKRVKIITLCSRRESMLIKQFVSKIDKDAFVTVTKVESVWGTGVGFSRLTDDDII
ncbi:MAG: YitT family protein [Clostridiales bacterium]|nr:YitT family protein [Clostridiales bacterium]